MKEVINDVLVNEGMISVMATACVWTQRRIQLSCTSTNRVRVKMQMLCSGPFVPRTYKTELMYTLFSLTKRCKLIYLKSMQVKIVVLVVNKQLQDSTS